jgi:hypothetical protein
MNLRPVTYVTAKEIRNRALNDETSFEDENNVITDTDNESEPDFDSLGDNEFDLILSGDYDAIDDNIEVN